MDRLENISLGDGLAVVAAIVLGVAFAFLPWFNIGHDVTVTGLQLVNSTLFELDFDASIMWLLPLATVIGMAAGIWGWIDKPARKITWAAAGIGGGIAFFYFFFLLFQNSRAGNDIMAFDAPGLWIGLLATAGLLFQIFVIRTPYANDDPRTYGDGQIRHPSDLLTVPFPVSLKQREIIAAYLFLAPFLIFFTIFIVRAVIIAVETSFYQYHVLRPARPYIGLDNYIELLNDDVWWIALENTLIFTLLTVIGTTVVGLFAAVLVTRPVRGQGFFRVLLYMPALFSVGSVGLIWVWLLNSQFGVLNYFLNSVFGIKPINWLGDPNLVIPALSLTTIWWGFGFPMLIFIAGLQGIPEQLYEAARIDGANPRQIFFRITLPLLRPTILFVTVTGVISHFQVYGQPLIMTSGGPGRESYTVIFYLWEIAWRAFRMGYGSAVAITLAFIMAAFTLMQFLVIGRRVEY